MPEESEVPDLSELLKMVPGATGYEPSSDARESAATLWEEYQANLQVGFKTNQALELVIRKQCAAVDAVIHYHSDFGQENGGQE